jgi:hypothetical protein
MGVQIVNTSKDRAALEMGREYIRKVYGSKQANQVALAPSTITAVVRLGTSNSYTANFLANQPSAGDFAESGLPNNRLKQSDLFIATGLEMSLAAGVATTEVDRARLHFQTNLGGIPAALRTDANFANFEAIYNGNIQIVSNTTRFLDGLDTKRFKQSFFDYYQQFIATGQNTIEGSYDSNQSTIELNPFILINGSEKFEFQLNLPAAVPLTLTGGVAFLRFDMRGLKAQNAANMTPENPSMIIGG